MPARYRQEMMVLVASGLPFVCAFSWALHERQESGRLPLTIDLSRPQLHVGLRGFASRESWGCWTEGDEAQVTLPTPLPPQFDLVLEARAFGPNAGEPIQLSAGGVVRTVVLDRTLTTRRIRFEEARADRTILIRIPHPESPRRLSLGTDDRLLGIGVSRILLVPSER
jgi:phosphoglycerol transferase